MEHVEHTRRLVRVGYGGSYEEIDGEVRPIYKLLKGRIAVTTPQTFANVAERDRNWLVCRQLLFEETCRMPWRDRGRRAHAVPRRNGTDTTPGP